MAESAGELRDEDNRYGPSYTSQWAGNPTEDPNTQLEDAW